MKSDITLDQVIGRTAFPQQYQPTYFSKTVPSVRTTKAFLFCGAPVLWNDLSPLLFKLVPEPVGLWKKPISFLGFWGQDDESLHLKEVNN